MPEHAIQCRDAGRGVTKVAAFGQGGVEREPVRAGHVSFRASLLGQACGAGVAGAADARRGRRRRGRRRRIRRGSRRTLPTIATVAIAFALRLLLAHHRRRRQDRFLHRDDQVTQHRVVELERVVELVQRLLVELDVHQHVVCLVDLGDRIGELPPAPVLETVNPAVAAGDRRAIPLDHGGHLLALVGMHDEYDFVMTHADCSFWSVGAAARCAGGRRMASPSAAGEAREFEIMPEKSSQIKQLASVTGAAPRPWRAASRQRRRGRAPGHVPSSAAPPVRGPARRSAAGCRLRPREAPRTAARGRHRGPRQRYRRCWRRSRTSGRTPARRPSPP